LKKGEAFHISKKEVYLETVGFRKEDIDRLSKVAKDQNTCVDAVIREGAREYAVNCDPDLKGWKIPHNLFVTLTVPEAVHKKLEYMQSLKHKIVVHVNRGGSVDLLDETGLDEHSKQDRFVLLKVPGAWEKEMKEAAAEKGPTEASP